MKKIIFDIETRTPLYVPETPEITDMQISVLSLYSSETEKYHSFTEENFSEMEDFFKNTDMLVTFNGVHFDIPVLQKYMPHTNLSEIYHVDVMLKVQESIGKRIGLDSIASNTLGTSKSANGLQAVA